jgi:hypothetical protein
MGVETAGVRSIFNTTGRSGLDESLRKMPRGERQSKKDSRESCNLGTVYL